MNVSQLSASLLKRVCGQSIVKVPLVRNATVWSIGNEPRKETIAIRERTKWLGFLVPLGSFIHERDVFLRQKGLKFHPGLNCALDPRDNSIYALRDGIIAISSERFVPDLNNESVLKHYIDYDGPMMVRYAHVMPPEQPKVFKLTQLV